MKDERLKHRLEAFSDIVLGFCMGQMTLNFVMPRHPLEVYGSAAMWAFAVTFLIVALAWRTHHYLFEYYFVPRPVPIVLNFLTLALIVWLTYQLQIYVHFADSADRAAAALGYGITFSIVWTLFGVLYALCIGLQWHDFETERRRSGVLAIARCAFVGLGTLLSIGIFWTLHLNPAYAFWSGLLWSFAPRAIEPLVRRYVT
ncbi:MAG: DUF1211 domain-containing protein [Candidatus Eremiobacteraeota bacterium]|nr:DUF1211 domain-containing protein [Candidatus Eremiobacteraeota bacterium]